MEEADVVADLDGFVGSGAKGEGLREFGHNLDEAFFAVLLFQDVLLRAWEKRHLLSWRSGMPLRPIEAVHHPACDLVFLQHDRDCLRGVDARIAFAATLGVHRERMFQLIGQAEVIDDQAAGLVAEDAVHAGDGLHEPVAAHRLVDIHCAERWRVEAGQPHVADDDDVERIFRIFETRSQFAPLFFVADVRLPVGAVFRAAGHDDLHDARLCQCHRR